MENLGKQQEATTIPNIMVLFTFVRLRRTVSQCARMGTVGVSKTKPESM